MARIAVVTSHPPFTEGGHLVIARALAAALEAAGHEASIVQTPQNRFGRQGTAYLATWFTDVGLTGNGHPIDQVVSLRFPSYAVRHPVHACWLNHTMREYYDLWDDFSAGLSRGGRAKETVRRACIRGADTFLLRRVTKLFAQSQTIQDRLRRWNGVDAEVLRPPAPPRPYRTDGYGDYFFFASRLAPLKRADLAIRAAAHPAAGRAPLVVAGEGEDLPRLERLARELAVDDRVTFTGRLDEAALVSHLARCRAVVFAPRREDYGFVTVEAFASRKAVITCTDSGGPTELVRDGQNGLVCPPEPGPIAAAMRRLLDDAALAERLGGEGHRVASALTWERAVASLVLV